MVLKPLRIAFAPLIIPRLPKRTVSFQGEEIECVYRRYNMTWACERCLEIPISSI